MKAKFYSSSCHYCTFPINIGDDISKYGHSWIHTRCHEKYIKEPHFGKQCDGCGIEGEVVTPTSFFSNMEKNQVYCPACWERLNAAFDPHHPLNIWEDIFREELW